MVQERSGFVGEEENGVLQRFCSFARQPWSSSLLRHP